MTSKPDTGIRDNHSRGTVADFLRAKIQSGSSLSVVSANFTIYAYDALWIKNGGRKVSGTFPKLKPSMASKQRSNNSD